MCGICGIFTTDNLAGQPEFSKAVQDMADMMNYRGPDAEGFWSDPYGHVQLGFRRLAILDLSTAGSQPMFSADGRSVIVFNGEIYNYKELRHELKSHGVEFRSQSDTEVLLEALNHWGVEALPRLNGMFAFAWYNRQTCILLLARDHAGIKPLYYFTHPSGKGLAFGSQYNLLLQTPWGQPGAIRSDVLKLYLHLHHIPAPYGLLQNTYQLEAGHYLLIQPNGQIEKRCWWQLPRNAEPDLIGDDALDALQSAIENAIQRQRVADVPLGVFLSGGIDSPLVTSIARQQTGPDLKAFTLASPGWRQDEAADASTYAHQLGVDHFINAVSGQDVLELLTAILSAQHEPFADFSIIPTFLLSKFARQQVTVALSGDGGDELLFGYERPRSLLRNGRDFRFPHWMRIAMYAFGKFKLTPRRSETIMAKSPGDYYFGVNSRFGGAEAFRQLAPSLKNFPEDFELYNFDGYQDERHLINFSRYAEFYGQLQRGLKKVDMASMANSLEVRVPLLDREVIEVALRIDPFESLKNGGRKLVLQNLLKRYVPSEIIPQTKRGFAVPLGDWLRGPLRPMMEEILLGDSLFERFEKDGMKKYWEEHLSGRADHKWGLWSLLTLQLWQKQWL